MAESKDEILSPDNSEDNLKFRDPLISGLDASDGEVCTQLNLINLFLSYVKQQQCINRGCVFNSVQWPTI